MPPPADADTLKIVSTELDCAGAPVYRRQRGDGRSPRHLHSGAGAVAAMKDGVSAADQSVISKLAVSALFSSGGGSIQTTSS